jgi:hypothetical protein
VCRTLSYWNEANTSCRKTRTVRGKFYKIYTTRETRREKDGSQGRRAGSLNLSMTTNSGKWLSNDNPVPMIPCVHTITTRVYQ